MKPPKAAQDDESTAPRHRPFRLYVHSFHYEGEIHVERIPLLAGHFNNVGRVTNLTRRDRGTGDMLVIGDAVTDVYGADAQDCYVRTKHAADTWCEHDARNAAPPP